MKKLSPLALALALTVCSGHPSFAEQMVCGKRDSIIAQLQQKYGETRRSFGLQQGRGLVEVWASEETGSWTILVTTPKGQTCLMAAGEAFEAERFFGRSDPA